MTEHLVIFSIDKAHDLHTMAKFLRWIDTQRALGKITYFKLAIGFFEGKYESSFVCLEKDFKEYVQALGYVKDQKSFLYVPSKGECFLRLQDGTEVMLGNLKSRIYPPRNAFTYLPEDNIYWTVE